MKTGIFYGSATGTTADVARRIGKALGVADADIHDVADTAPDKVGDYDLLVIGSSTWGNGELEDDWYDFLAGMQVLDLKGKKIAIFGCGDESMSETFCNAVGILYDRLRDTGANFIGEYPATEYSFEHSDAADGATMRGLLLDEVNPPALPDSRIEKWTAKVKEEL